MFQQFCLRVIHLLTLAKDQQLLEWPTVALSRVKNFI